MRKFLSALILVATVALSGCQFIETGNVGVRIDATKQIEPGELLPRSLPYQTVIGNIIEFTVRDLVVEVNDKKYTTQGDIPLDDFDLTAVYSVNPSAAAELYSKQSKAFHSVDEKGNTLLMYRRVETILNNAAYKEVRKYTTEEISDKRQQIESNILETAQATLKAEGLAESINLTSIQVRSIVPNAAIMRQKVELASSANRVRIKENEVKEAKAESERMQALANNSQSSIAYMNAQAALNISEGVKNGKVHTIVVPVDFKGIVNTSK